ncbi:LacI family transcriptional regulator [Arthrobacter sp. NtRootA4]|nr:LacI family transcriptional regulator [Arthrobacter sp. NtRootA2]BCW16432.1 LacI family transcriptional regulator [Arthrobacter sp. NtRootA4]BCW24765.1 LacI family transcriptional regulator [Arthrobacter sp. NtRootC7]BCW29034.1 LacI family transcriptional regulator [Arthrobacter sp. NtRootC45]BCW33304.1 LacI family transcriptional regulator [Arthrobacter sp. NtRootD5]GGV37504.1 LacI family transcriptional regulator [Paenarthrobacter nicotinovorans]
MAGVSHQTVSRVLNNHPNVSSKTRERVEQAITELGYRRNTAARSLVTRRSQTIGVLGSELAQYGPSHTLLGVQQAARDAGYFVSVAGLREVTPETIKDAIAHFMDQGVDGIVVTVPHPGTFDVLRDITAQVPLVAVGSIGDEHLSGATVDQRQGAQLAVQHLLELGHQEIGHLSGPVDWIDAAARIEGWQDALAQAGLEPAALIEGDWSAECGYREGLKISADRSMTALFVANDQMALGVLRAFNETGVRVPDDISVVGFDDQPESAYFIPPLTTVAQDFEELGQRCIDLLLDRIEGGSTGMAATVAPRLVVRSTTAALRN